MDSTHPDDTRPPATEVTWSIAEVERDTGLGKDTLRVWERRYGFPTPLRDGLGERLYPQDQVQRLRLLKRLLDSGHRPGKVVPLPMTELQGLMQGSPRATARAAQAAPAPELDPASSWLDWLAQDRTDLVKQALQQHILRQGLGATVEQVVGPLCRHVGEGWLRGELSIYQEHLFTATVQTVLREAIASVDASSPALQQQPRVLLTTTPAEPHGLGLLMAECFFTLESCTRFVLGVCTPIADIVLAVRQLRIDVLALSYSAYTTRRDLQDSLQQLTAQLPEGVEIWVGGVAASQHRRTIPAPVTVLRQSSDVAARVQGWKARAAAQAAAPALSAPAPAAPAAPA
jgi:DNA-binding transcriptional MerR regulator/methylmalonyl-CoA mutase cobalamin-binding subunit